MWRDAGRRGRAVVTAAVGIAHRTHIGFLTAAVTFYALLSFVPLVALVFVAIGAVADYAVASSVAAGLARFFPPTGRELLQAVALDRAAAGTTVASAVLLGWGAFHLFRSLDIAFHKIYETAEPPSITHQARHAVVALLSIALAVLVTAMTGTFILVFAHVQLVGVIWVVTQFVSLVIVFVPLYNTFTHPHDWQTLLPGAVVSAAGWTALQTVFTAYTQTVGGSLYAVFGGIFLFILWLYAAAFLILFGATLNRAVQEVASAG